MYTKIAFIEKRTVFLKRCRRGEFGNSISSVPRAVRNNLVIFNADPLGNAPYKFIITKCKVCLCYDNRKKRGELIEWDTNGGCHVEKRFKSIMFKLETLLDTTPPKSVFPPILGAPLPILHSFRHHLAHNSHVV